MKQFLLITCAFFFILQSPVLAQKSWKNIFDGKTLDGWKQMAGKAEYSVCPGDDYGQVGALFTEQFSMY